MSRRKTRLVLCRVIAGLLLIAAIGYGSLLAAVLAGAHTRLDGQVQTMMILGCQVQPWGPSILLQDRLDTALDYLETRPEMTVIVTGGKGSDEVVSEAACMRDYLISHGVDERRILMEDKSSNTHQNVVRSLRLMEEQGISPADGVLIVSNGFHLTRARMLWHRETALEASTLAAPSTHLPSRIAMTLREPLALAKSYLFDR